MNCRKCGTSLEQKDFYCPNCGEPQSKGRKKHGILKTIAALTVLFALVTVALFAGIEIGDSHSGALPERPNFIKMISSAITSLPGIPFDIELTQEKLNAMINKDPELLSPISGAKLTISGNKTLILSGNVDKEDLKSILEGSIPSYLSIFLPQTVSLYVEVEFLQNGTEPFNVSIINATVAGITFSEDLVSMLGINDLASKIISEVITSEKSHYYTVTGITIDKSKNSEENVLIISGSAKLS